MTDDSKEAVTTYTPLLWASMTEEERYAEYIRVRGRIAERDDPSGRLIALRSKKEDEGDPRNRPTVPRPTICPRDTTATGCA